MSKTCYGKNETSQPQPRPTTAAAAAREVDKAPDGIWKAVSRKRKITNPLFLKAEHTNSKTIRKTTTITAVADRDAAAAATKTATIR